MHSATRQVLTMYGRKRTRKEAECLMGKLPENLKKPFFIQTKFSAYDEVIPSMQHRLSWKEIGRNKLY
nr:hypothetical protein [Candidatus Protochlamydia amoebophila]